MITRRQALKTTALASAAVVTLSLAHAQTNAPAVVPVATGPFTLPPLPYAYGALEPFIDARTMEIHHDKHHAAYVANLNKAVAAYPALAKMSVEELLKDLTAIPEPIRATVRNNGGGHYNHSLFWQSLKKDGGAPKGSLASAINQRFGSFDKFKTDLSKAAIGQFGSGWAWLMIDKTKELTIEGLPNQDSPISEAKKPLFGIDVWEHAYYLKYQNRRPDYVAAFFNVINWDFVSDRYDKLTS